MKRRHRKLMRIRLTSFLALVLLLVTSVSMAAPMKQAEDFSGSIVIPYDEDNPEAGAFTFIYCYPCIDESEPDANIVNSFYREQMDMDETNMRFFADGYAASGIPVVKEISYRITCNNNDFFSVLTVQHLQTGDNDRLIWSGNTFSRRSGEVGSTYDLPRLLGLLSESEQDEFLIERQADKAADVVVELIMEMILDNPDDLPYHYDITFDTLMNYVYPQEDFYLDETGNPVFFAAPGTVADEAEGYMVFPIPLQDILDEL